MPLLVLVLVYWFCAASPAGAQTKSVADLASYRGADREEVLKAGNFRKISIANPTSAPYGSAAVETMKALSVWDALQPKLVQGSSIAQAFQFIDTRNAELGFIALAQLYGVKGGTRWTVPDKLHSPILQDAVLLKKGADNKAAKAFLAFLKGPEARAVIERYGYALE